MREWVIAIATVVMVGCALTADPQYTAVGSSDDGASGDGASDGSDAAAPRQPCDPCADDTDCVTWPGYRCVAREDGGRACGDPNQPLACDAPDLSRCWNPPGDPNGCTVMGCESLRPDTAGRAFCFTPELCCAR